MQPLGAEQPHRPGSSALATAWWRDEGKVMGPSIALVCDQFLVACKTLRHDPGGHLVSEVGQSPGERRGTVTW